MKLFALQDTKAEYFLPPMMLRSKGEAIRNVQMALKQADTPIAQDPSSFILVELGEYNQDNGQIIPSVPLKNIGSAQEFVLEQ